MSAVGGRMPINMSGDTLGDFPEGQYTAVNWNEVSGL